MNNIIRVYSRNSRVTPSLGPLCPSSEMSKELKRETKTTKILFPKSQSGAAVTNSNFREDVTADGFINSADISLVKSKSGTALP